MDNFSVLPPLFLYFLHKRDDGEIQRDLDKLGIPPLDELDEDGFRKSFLKFARKPPAYDAAIYTERTNEQYRPGYIYLLQSEYGFWKVGRARELSSRLTQLQLVIPFRVKAIAAIASCDYISEEKDFHDFFADTRTNGEWFQLQEEAVDFFIWMSLDKKIGGDE